MANPTQASVRITSRDLEAWRKRWPCSTLATGWAAFDRGDLVDLGGKLAKVDPDAHELNAFLEWKVGTSRPGGEG